MKEWNKIAGFARGCMSTLENVRLGWGSVLFLAAGIIAVRVVLEVTLSPIPRPHLFWDIVFFECWFLALFFSLASFISYVSGKKALTIFRLFLFGLPIIILPLIGLWLGKVQVFVWPNGSWADLAYHFITLFLFHPSFGIYFTLEIFLFLCAVFIYVLSLTSIIRAFFGVLGVYGILAFFALQGKILEYVYSSFSATTLPPTQFYLTVNFLILIMVCIFIFWQRDPLQAGAFIRRFRPKRMVFGVALVMMLAIGALLAPQFYFFNFLYSVIILGLFLLYATLSNDLADIEIDTISNPIRPYASGMVSEKEMRFFKNFILAILFVFAAMINSFSLFIITLANVFLSVLYSPLRMRKYFFAFIIAALGESTAVLYGYFGQQLSSISIPSDVLQFFAAFFLLLCFFLPVKDLKDRAGDLQAGVKNILTVFLWEKAKMIIAVMVFLGYVGMPLLLWGSFISSIVFLPLSLFSAFFVFRYERFGEQPLYFIFLLSVFLVLLSFMV